MRTTDHKTKFGRQLAILSIAAFILTAGAPAATAATVQSDTRYLGTRSGKAIYSFSFVNDSGSGITDGQTYTSSASALPTGELGAAARLYHQNGVLCKGGSMVYSNVSTTSWRVQVFGSCGIDNYYGFGRATYWMGTNYVPATNNYTTPYIALP